LGQQQYNFCLQSAAHIILLYAWKPVVLPSLS
jgi:hypothetical protein